MSDFIEFDSFDTVDTLNEKKSKNKQNASQIKVDISSAPVENNTFVKAVRYDSKFNKDLESISEQKNFKKDTFKFVIQCLASGNPLPGNYHVHKMSASGVKYEGCMNCHIAPDIVMIYTIMSDTVILLRIGSHSKLGITHGHH